MEVRIPQLEPYLAGMFAELRCSIILDDVVDTSVDIEVVWQRNGVVLSETDRITTLPARLIEDYHYESSLQFSTLSSSMDNGNYICIGTVFPTAERMFIDNSTATATFSISVTGIATSIL